VCDERWWFRERLGVVKKNHVDACALGWRTCPKQQATLLGTPVSLPFLWKPPWKMYCGPHLLILNANKPMYVQISHIYKLCSLGVPFMLFYTTPHNTTPLLKELHHGNFFTPFTCFPLFEGSASSGS